MLVLEEDRNMFYRFIYEHLTSNNLVLIEKGITMTLPDFNSLMFAVIRKK